MAVDNKPKLKRLTIDLTPEAHRVLKSRAAKAGMTMRKLVLQTLQDEGLVTEPDVTKPLAPEPNAPGANATEPLAMETGANASEPHEEAIDD